MNNINMHYLGQVISDLTGIPVRIYHNDELEFFYSYISFIKDPIDIDLKEIMKIKNHISYYVTSHFMYYGIVNYGEYKFIIGPANQMNLSEAQYDELAFLNGITKEDKDTFINNLKSINKMPLESIVQILCTINYLLNNEELSLKDIVIHDNMQNMLKTNETDKIDNITDKSYNPNVLSTYKIEEYMLMCVKKGDVEGLRDLFSKTGAVHGGVLAASQIRQIKNTFIVSTTLVSRAAIDGGLEINDALDLSDAYIQKCELLNSIDEILNLQYHMVIQYASKVAKLNYMNHESKIIKDVANYVLNHISKNITVEEVAGNLYISRPYLSRKFKAESGISVSDFIISCKIEEAKTLLAYSDKSITAISEYLAFANPSHFTRIFKKITGLTPLQYRNNHIH